MKHSTKKFHISKDSIIGKMTEAEPKMHKVPSSAYPGKALHHKKSKY